MKPGYCDGALASGAVVMSACDPGKTVVDVQPEIRCCVVIPLAYCGERWILVGEIDQPTGLLPSHSIKTGRLPIGAHL
jgi:hypothetical protein